jgi:eukaryotic-like serine/threonine-protein kinase
LFAQAADLDRQWPQPEIRRGWGAYKRARFFVADQARAAAWIDTGLVHAERALALAAKNPDALELRGSLRYLQYLMGLVPDPAAAKRTLADAQSDLEKSTKVNPGQAGAWAMLSHLYYQTSEGAEGAKLAARRAYEEDAYLSNADVVLWRLFLSSYDLGQFVDGNHWCDVMAHRFPADSRSVECRLYMLGTKAQRPDVPLAWRLTDSLVKLSPGPKRAFATLNGQAMVAAVIARAGLADSTRHVLSRINENEDLDPTHDIAESKGYVWTLLGDKEHALRQLKVYLAANPDQATDLASGDDWRWRSLQDDPRYQALVNGGKTAR